MGFGRTDLATARNVVLALGVIYLVIGILGFVVPMVFGLIPHGYTIFDDLLHLALGVLSLAVALFYAPGGATAARSYGGPPSKPREVKPATLGSLAAGRPKPILYAAAALSLVAALIHLWVMPEHFQEWWGYGSFFLVAASAQVLYVPLLLRWPTRTVLLLGIAGNLAIVVLYLPTPMVGIPFFGPEAGEGERVGSQMCAPRPLSWASVLRWVRRCCGRPHPRGSALSC